MDDLTSFILTAFLLAIILLAVSLHKNFRPRKSVPKTLSPKRRAQYSIIEDVKAKMLDWANLRNIDLVHLQFDVSLIESEDEMHPVLFFKYDADVSRYGENGITKEVTEHFFELLKSADYPEGMLTVNSISFDSEENVIKNYDGNYFHYWKR